MKNPTLTVYEVNSPVTLHPPNAVDVAPIFVKLLLCGLLLYRGRTLYRQHARIMPL